ncbi:hypothetical protein SAMN05444682_10497 [Parapedobacter indicus]|uniref:Uncharacterized protein n=1 Tax=Parapedobacter indicus TaxID=1477437 RepID=A0A1I3IHC7_9SPHI|nr:hypothetical protein CLV26_10497 [Parapedobacter indicus]SFI47445.1 hypothetical protein SAMN05444682_10497 [Parapedobacter indicus]
MEPLMIKITIQHTGNGYFDHVGFMGTNYDKNVLIYKFSAIPVSPYPKTLSKLTPKLLLIVKHDSY